MVSLVVLIPDGDEPLSVLALSSRFDGPSLMCVAGPRISLSVLALSSRFDGHLLKRRHPRSVPLSVLALSSRFDGRPTNTAPGHISPAFSTRSVESF